MQERRNKPLTRTEALRRAGRHEEADAAQRAYARNRPKITPFTTTLWDYPSRSYGTTTQGNQRYTGATPGWVIWQLLNRYTRPGDAVLDPMCGGGTTIDVAKDFNCTPIAYDLVPARDDINQADARQLPLKNNSIDFAFVDPPYSTHIRYSDHPDCIGRLDALDPPQSNQHLNEYYHSMQTVIDELHRVLRDEKHMALYVSDTFRNARPNQQPAFEPIGFELFAMLRARFTPVDIVTVVRRNAKLDKGNWRKSADEQGFMMRGFNYLFIMKKTSQNTRETDPKPTMPIRHPHHPPE